MLVENDELKECYYIDSSNKPTIILPSIDRDFNPKTHKEGG